jgi:4-amino-4-deoxy-L-arabinose transferase-like glycosyltransferase
MSKLAPISLRRAGDQRTIHMRTGALLARLASGAILVFAFGVAVQRARVQPIAHDEALTYEWFLDQGVYDVLRYNPANHVLQTLLAKPIVKILGVSEFTLRIATLIGAAIYLIAVYFLCRRLFGDGLTMVLSVTMMALNPQVMDFLAAARGYSLGLAGLAVAMYAFARLTDRGKFDPGDKEWRWGCAAASISLALAVAANFTNIVPATCLALSFTAVALGGIATLFRFQERAIREYAKYFILPGLAAGFCILWPFLIQARLAQAKIQLDKASDAMRDIFNASFLYKWTDDVFNSLGAVPPAAGSWQERATELGANFLLPLLFCFVLAGLILAFRASTDSEKRQSAECRIFPGAAIASVVLTVLLHFATKVNYPFSRYRLFLVPLFTIAGMLTARRISSRFPWLLLKGAGLLLGAVVVSDYALSVNMKSFRYNAYDVISRDLYQAIERDALSRGLTNVRAGGTWWYEPEINFYRLRHRAKWMLPYEIKDRSYWWQTPGALEPASYDYFVYVPPSDPHLTGPRVRTIFHDEKTQATIIAIAHD